LVFSISDWRKFVDSVDEVLRRKSRLLIRNVSMQYSPKQQDYSLLYLLYKVFLINENICQRWICKSKSTTDLEKIEKLEC